MLESAESEFNELNKKKQVRGETYKWFFPSPCTNFLHLFVRTVHIYLHVCECADLFTYKNRCICTYPVLNHHDRDDIVIPSLKITKAMYIQ
jgi:hypothetical protein